MGPGITPDFDRLASLLRSSPSLALIRQQAGDMPVHLVGGAIRDALAGREIDDLDLVIEGDPSPLASRLDPVAKVNERFGTVDLIVEGVPVDIAMARTETYARPGALPDVTPGKLEDDLHRRDFTINAMAIPIDEGKELLDPYGGVADLKSGVIRVLHDLSFEDDPTRAFRAAKYAARFGFDLDPKTADLLMATRTGDVSRERIEAELGMLAREDQALEGLRLSLVWGLVDFDPERLDLAANVIDLLGEDLWKGQAGSPEAILASVFTDLSFIEGLVPEPGDPWEGYQRAAGFSPLELLLARASGVEWLDAWQRDWRWVELQITGADLLAAGLAEGPGLGQALDAAMKAKLNSQVDGVEEELAIALAAAEARPG